MPVRKAWARIVTYTETWRRLCAIDDCGAQLYRSIGGRSRFSSDDSIADSAVRALVAMT
jgi:hypothetical protein